MSSGTRKKDRAAPSSGGAGGAPSAGTRPPRKGRQAQRLAEVKGKRRGLTMGTKLALFVGAAIVALALIFFSNTLSKSTGGTSSGANHQGSGYPFAVGNPGPGHQAPSIKLPSTTGGTFDLASQRGHTVLLYFQEGVSCQPCWDQIKAIEPKWSRFRALGIDKMVVITGNSLGDLRQKVSDEKISVPVLSDPDLSVSQSYQANQYGMMGTSADGHSFILVSKDGMIKWRADYGGPPQYTMYVPVSNLLTDMRKGLGGKSV